MFFFVKPVVNPFLAVIEICESKQNPSPKSSKIVIQVGMPPHLCHVSTHSHAALQHGVESDLAKSHDPPVPDHGWPHGRKSDE